MNEADRNYIADCGTDDDVNAVISEKISGGNMILMYTDKFVCMPRQTVSDTEHLLEARVFTEYAELKIMRPTIADKFTWRLIDDRKNPDTDKIEERHYLSIDKKRSYGKRYFAIGGGEYELPVENAERVLVYNYISYDNQGIAQITDFRVVKYLVGGER